MTMRHPLRRTLVATMALAIASVAFAGQVEIRLKNGSRWKGGLPELVRMTVMQQGVQMELTGHLVKASEWHVTIETDVAGEIRNKTIFKSDIISIKTVAADAAAYLDIRPLRGDGTTGPARPGADPDQPGVFVLPLSKMVGLEFRHEEMEAIAEEADKYGPGQIIVLLIDSGGGSVVEMETIHDTLRDIKKRHRLVAWIKQAISAACATAMHCDEIYFMTEGTAGAMTAFNGATGQAWKDEKLDEWMRRAGNWMSEGGRSPYIAEAMIHAPNLLSYDKDPVTGQVTFYNDLSGETILSRDEENLVFTASLALDCGFSDGTADTEDELAELLDLPAWNEKSDVGRELAADWVATCELANRELRLLNSRLQYAGSGSGDPVEILGKRIKIYEQFIRWHSRCPNCAMMAGLPPEEILQREIKDFRKELADLKRRRR